MTSLSISFVYQAASGPSQGDAGAANAYARFIKELGLHAACAVKTFDRLHDVPSSDFIVFAGSDARATLEACPADMQPSIAQRLIPINASRPKIFEKLLEPLSIPGAIDSMSLLEWEHGAGVPGARGLYGLREVGKLAGAVCMLFESARYCFLQSATHSGLPHLLADYLAALGATNE